MGSMAAITPASEVASFVAGIIIVAGLLFIAPKSYRERVFFILREVFSFRLHHHVK